MTLSIAGFFCFRNGLWLCFHFYQYRPRHSAERIRGKQDVVIFTRQQREIGAVFVLEHNIALVRPDETVLAHFISIDLPESVDFDLVAVFQLLEIDEDAGRVVCIPHVTRDHGVARPRGESRTVQPADIVSQPRDVPAIRSLRHADDGGVDSKRWNLQC